MLQSVTECNKMLQSVTECYRVLQSSTKTNLAHLLGPIFGLVFWGRTFLGPQMYHSRILGGAGPVVRQWQRREQISDATLHRLGAWQHFNVLRLELGCVCQVAVQSNTLQKKSRFKAQGQASFICDICIVY